jgi:hypothetical protein
MSAPTSDDVFADVVNCMIKELHALPHSATIIHLVIHNVDSPVLAEIQHLSLAKLSTNQMTALLPVLAKMTSLTSLALPKCELSPDHFKFLFTECPAISDLESLDLSGMKQLKSEDLELFSKSTTLTNLTSLNLRNCLAKGSGDGFGGFGSFHHDLSQGLRDLLRSPVVENLTSLI